MSAATAEKVARWFADKLGVAPTRDALASVPLDTFMRAQAELRGDIVARRDPLQCGDEVMVSMMPWQPVVDGTIIPARPIDRIEAGCASTIDLIVGSAIEEFRFFLVPGGAIDAMTPEMLAGVIAGYGMPVKETLAKYRSLYPGATAGDLIAAVQSDWYFRAPTARLAETHAKSATSGTTHVYEFAWRSPQFGGRLGACHGLDVAFVFDMFDEGTEALSGKTPPRQLADAMHGAWVEFARSSHCAWPLFDLEHRTRMRFDTESHVVQE